MGLLWDNLEELRTDEAGLTEGLGIDMGERRLWRESDGLFGVSIDRLGL